MLHPIPNSIFRRRLLRIVVMQRRLMAELCALPQDYVIDEAWLQSVWPTVSVEWIRRFWENDSGNRANWLTTIAAAPEADKQIIRDMIAEQLRFAELYQDPPTIRLTRHNWNTPVFRSLNNLLKSFYAPLFYKREGYLKPSGESFHKDHFISGFTPRFRICPYTDNYIQDTKLDHFLPKDEFPMLSCHPDNLIPCSSDPNSVGHKGAEIPLDSAEIDQAKHWYHPRLRPCAVGSYRLLFPAVPASQPQIDFEAVSAADQPRLDNMVRLFGLGSFWGGFLDDEVQNIASDVSGLLSFDGNPPTGENVKAGILLRARQEQGRIGRDGLAIVKSFFYEHIAQTPVLLAQVVRICAQGT